MEEVCKTSTEFQAQALEDDIFEWHFIIAGPRDTDFEVRQAARISGWVA